MSDDTDTTPDAPQGEPYIDVATGEPGHFDPDGGTLPCCLSIVDPDTGHAYSADGSLRLPERDVEPEQREPGA